MAPTNKRQNTKTTTKISRKKPRVQSEMQPSHEGNEGTESEEDVILVSGLEETLDKGKTCWEKKSWCRTLHPYWDYVSYATSKSNRILLSLKCKACSRVGVTDMRIGKDLYNFKRHMLVFIYFITRYPMRELKDQSWLIILYGYYWRE